MSEIAAPTSIREQQRAFTRERLLQGGLKVFGSKGYNAATVDDIVGAVGASRATFYLHFHSKSDIVRELSSRLLPEVQGQYEQLDEVLADGSRRAMREWMTAAIEWMERNETLQAASEAARHAEGAVASYRETLFLADRMPRYLASWPRGMQRQARTRVALLAVQFRATYTFLLRTDDVRAEIPRDELVDAMTDIWLTGLRPPERAAGRRRS